MAKILLVEDDKQLAEDIRTLLAGDGYVVDIAYDGADGLQLLEHNKYELSILDWELPSVSGLEICRLIRKSNQRARIMFLTGRDTVEDKIDGFDMGADDYLVKPIQPRELTMRIKALLRRIDSAPEPPLKARDLEVQPQLYKAYKGGKLLNLSPREFALLAFFLKNPNQVFNTKILLQEVWPENKEVGEVAVRTQIKTLRKKITGPEGDCPLVNVFGEGYKFEI